MNFIEKVTCPRCGGSNIKSHSHPALRWRREDAYIGTNFEFYCPSCFWTWTTAQEFERLKYRKRPPKLTIKSEGVQRWIVENIHMLNVTNNLRHGWRAGLMSGLQSWTFRWTPQEALLDLYRQVHGLEKLPFRRMI